MNRLAVVALFASACFAQNTVFQLHGTAADVSGTTDGSTVTPVVGPAGVLTVKGTGAANFGSAGVSFAGCCSNANNAFYQFSGQAIGSVFTMDSGEIDFTLTSAYSFAQRQALEGGFRVVFDVQDALGPPGMHQFGLNTQANASGIVLSYWTGGGTSAYYYLPAVQADAMFGTGVALKIGLAWSSAGFVLSLNGMPVQTTPYTASNTTWNSNSAFLIGAQPYGTAGNGYNSDDDFISEFWVISSGTPPTPPTPIAPAFTSASSATMAAGSQSSFRVKASGFPAPVLAEAEAPPAGLSFDPATGILSGIPASSGTATLNFTATNSEGTATQALALTVNPASRISLVCAGILDSLTGTISANCTAPNGSAFSSFSVLVPVSGSSAQWQIDARKYLAAFGSNP